MQTKNSKIGLTLFTVYTVIYLGFVLLSVFKPEVMETTPIAGVNLAIIYGFVLIITACLLSLLYGFLCRESKHDNANGKSP